MGFCHRGAFVHGAFHLLPSVGTKGEAQIIKYWGRGPKQGVSIRGEAQIMYFIMGIELVTALRHDLLIDH